MILLDLLLAYFITGFMLAIWFIFFKLGEIIGRKHASFWFRLIIMPGTIFLWPWVLSRILRNSKAD
jgi:hypothetical protein